MNMIDVQDKLKNLSEDQLVKEMQAPSGTAPQFLVLSEITRRKRMRESFQNQQAQPTTTIAEEAIASAGVPGGGIAEMARSMAPNSSMAQNTAAMPSQPMPEEPPVQGMYGGGPVRKMQDGGYFSRSPNEDDWFLDMLNPVVGAEQSVRDYQEGDYPGAVLNAASAFPFTKGLGLAGRAALTVAPEVYEYLYPEKEGRRPLRPNTMSGGGYVQKMAGGRQAADMSNPMMAAWVQREAQRRGVSVEDVLANLGPTGNAMARQAQIKSERNRMLGLEPSGDGMTFPSQEDLDQRYADDQSGDTFRMPSQEDLDSRTRERNQREAIFPDSGFTPDPPEILGFGRPDPSQPPQARPPFTMDYRSQAVDRATGRGGREGILDALLASGTPGLDASRLLPDVDGMREDQRQQRIRDQGPYYPGTGAASELNLPAFRTSSSGGAGFATGLEEAAAAGGDSGVDLDLTAPDDGRTWGQRNIGDPLRDLFKPIGDAGREIGQAVGDPLRAAGQYVNENTPRFQLGPIRSEDEVTNLRMARQAQFEPPVYPEEQEDPGSSPLDRQGNLLALQDEAKANRMGPVTEFSKTNPILDLPPAPDRSGVMGTNETRSLGPNSLRSIPDALSDALSTEVTIGPDGRITTKPAARDVGPTELQNPAFRRMIEGGGEIPSEKPPKGGGITTDTAGVSASPNSSTSVTGRGSGAAVGGANAPTSYEQELRDAMSRAEKRANQDKWMALAQVGMQLMASKEPTLGGALGEAGIAGLQAYQKSRDDYENERLGLTKSLFDLQQNQQDRALASQRAAAKKALTPSDEIRTLTAYRDALYEDGVDDYGQKTRVPKPGAKGKIEQIDERIGNIIAGQVAPTM